MLLENDTQAQTARHLGKAWWHLGSSGEGLNDMGAVPCLVTPEEDAHGRTVVQLGHGRERFADLAQVEASGSGDQVINVGSFYNGDVPDSQFTRVQLSWRDGV